MTQLGIETGRLSLRPMVPEDASLLLMLDSDPEVMRFISGGRPSTAAEVAETVGRSIGHRWLAFETSTSVGGTSEDGSEDGAGQGFVGWFGLGADPQPTTRELGYRLAHRHWGKGFGTEGAMALVTHGFADLGLQRIWAQTMVVNAASRAVMDKCGLRFVRVFRGHWDDPIDGAEHGDVIYEIHRDDWERPAAFRSSTGR